MKQNLLLLSLFAFLNVVTESVIAQPYWGTIFIDSTIVTASDPTTWVSTTYSGQGPRVVYDRRIPGWTTINAYLFDIVWNDGLTTEAQVNPEFGNDSLAFIEANKYGIVIGRLPKCLREDVNSLWIHKGTESFGGGNFSILIHTGQSAIYETQGILEETLIHEASHTSLDAAHASSPGWLNAQNNDPNFISTYAANNPTTEDISESFLTWIMVRQCTQRVSQQNFDSISLNIPNRLAYFDSQILNLLPLCVTTTGIVEQNERAIRIAPNPFVSNARITSDKAFLNATLVLYNQLGQLVHTSSGWQGKELLIHRNNLSAGIYFVQIIEQSQLLFKQKIIVMD